MTPTGITETLLHLTNSINKAYCLGLKEPKADFNPPTQKGADAPPVPFEPPVDDYTLFEKDDGTEVYCEVVWLKHSRTLCLGGIWTLDGKHADLTSSEYHEACAQAREARE